MAVSGSVDFNLTRNEIITEAFGLIGVGVEGEALEAEEMNIGARRLNMMVKAWAADGLHLWKYSEQATTLTNATASYSLSGTSRPLRILNMRYDDGSTEIPMIEYSRQEYFDLPDRTTAGPPTAWYYDPGRGHSSSDGTLYVWPVIATVSSDTVNYTAELPMDDFDASTDNADMPTEWLEALTYNLAVRLCGNYDVPMDERLWLKQQAAEFKFDAENFDRETASINFGPDLEGRP